MLVLSRFVGERVVIDNDIVIEVLEVRGKRIRLGIQAPPGSTILRSELLIREEEEAHRTPASEELAHAGER